MKYLTVWPSSLPGVTKKTYSNATDKVTIERILACLRNSKYVGLEKPPIGKGGYPPKVDITLNNGNTVSISPAFNWSKTKLANGDTEISGMNAIGYVAIDINNQVIRLYSPELYKWIVERK